jgi:hypothetical protein
MKDHDVGVITYCGLNFHAYPRPELYGLWNAAREHLRHYARAVDIDCLLAGAQLRGNLLVQPTVNNRTLSADSNART